MSTTYVYAGGGLASSEIHTFELLEAPSGAPTIQRAASSGGPFVLAPPPGPAAAKADPAVGRVLPPVGWVALHPSSTMLVAADKTNWPGTAPGCGCVRVVALEDGKPVRELGVPQCSEGAGPCHLTVTQRHVLVANYVGGTVAVLPLLPDGGGVGPSVCTQTHPAAGAGAHARQDMAHPHMITLCPDQRFAFVPDLGNNIVVTYAYDDSTGQLTPHNQTALPAGSGPRHMVFHPRAHCAFVLNELNNTISTLPYDPATGTLSTPTATISALVEQPGRRSDRGGAAEVVVSADGSRVYSTVRLGRDADPMEAAPAFPFGVEYNVVASFAVDQSDGALTLLGNVSSGGSMPWGCVLVPAAANGGTEDVLLVQNQYSRWAGEAQGTGGEGIGQLTAFVCGGKDGEGAATFAGGHAAIDNFMSLAIAKL